jgi:hypothetical protein
MHRSTPISTRKARAHLSMALLSLVAAAALVLSAPATAAPKC